MLIWLAGYFSIRPPKNSRRAYLASLCERIMKHISFSVLGWFRKSEYQLFTSSQTNKQAMATSQKQNVQHSNVYTKINSKDTSFLSFVANVEVAPQYKTFSSQEMSRKHYLHQQ